MSIENVKRSGPPSDSNELSDDQLENVAGGMGLSPSQQAALAAAIKNKGPAAGGDVNTPKSPVEPGFSPAQQPKT